MRKSRCSPLSRVLVGALGLLAAVPLSSAAFAWPAAQAAASDTPDSLIAQGVLLREKREDEAALSLFQRDYQLSRSPRALAQVALAEQALGRWIDAQTHLSRALSQGGDPWIAAKASLLRQALA